MIDLYPKATFIPSPNYWTGRQGQEVLAIVDHIAEGSLAGCDSWFLNPHPINPQTGLPDRNLAVSAHFCIGLDGTVHQYVKLSNAAWANGVVEPGNTMPTSWPPGNPNNYCISVEHAGDAGQPLPEAQYQADLALHAWLLGQAGLAPGPDTIVGHYRISPHSRPTCPGSTFYFGRLFNDLSPINWGHHRIFIDWSAARWAQRQVFWGQEGLAAFKQNLVALGCDPATPGEYGYPI